MVTLTGDNNYSGIYDSISVLGGANYGGHDDFDATDGNEVFMFGNLQYKSTTVTDNSYDGSGNLVTGGTYQSTATGTSNDTLHFSFSGSEAQHFTFEAWNGLQNGHESYNGVENAYEAWLATLPTGVQFSDGISGQFQSGQDHSTTPPTPTYTEFDGYLHADVAGTGITADHGGAKTLLGFSVGSDHIALDGITTELAFDENFTVTSTTHQSANNNVVHDTTITFNGGNWSVDLYGVDSTSLTTEADLQHFAWSQLTSNGQSV